MKKILVSIVAALMAVPSFAQFSSGGFELDKQSLYYGVRFGGTVASINGDISIGSKVGMTLAGVIGLRVSSTTPLFLESGLYYTQRGAKNSDYNIVHNNLEFPILIKYGIQASDNIAVLPFFGPFFAYGVSTDEKLKTEYALTHDIRVNRNNMGFKIGCGAEYNKLYAEIGYQFGVTNIIDDEYEFGRDKSSRNNALFFNVGVNF
ncbi:MAG: hypothetical protein IJQ04_04530 [Prevotella sp.]|nr:hypothetical protein [Prevotella sp.]